MYMDKAAPDVMMDFEESYVILRELRVAILDGLNILLANIMDTRGYYSTRPEKRVVLRKMYLTEKRNFARIERLLNVLQSIERNELNKYKASLTNYGAYNEDFCNRCNNTVVKQRFRCITPLNPVPKDFRPSSIDQIYKFDVNRDRYHVLFKFDEATIAEIVGLSCRIYDDELDKIELNLPDSAACKILVMEDEPDFNGIFQELVDKFDEFYKKNPLTVEEEVELFQHIEDRFRKSIECTLSYGRRLDDGDDDQLLQNVHAVKCIQRLLANFKSHYMLANGDLCHTSTINKWDGTPDDHDTWNLYARVHGMVYNIASVARDNDVYKKISLGPDFGVLWSAPGLPGMEEARRYFHSSRCQGERPLSLTTYKEPTFVMKDDKLSMNFCGFTFEPRKKK